MPFYYQILIVACMSHLKRLPGRNLFCEHSPQGFIQDFELGVGGKQDGSRMIVVCISVHGY